MDDCTLKSLKVKPGQLSPVFRPDTIDYKATVGSKVTTMTILCETSDKDASFSILVGITASVRSVAKAVKTDKITHLAILYTHYSLLYPFL